MERSYNTEWLDKLKGLRLEGESKPGPVGRPVREYLSDPALFRAWGGGDLEFKVARLLETGGASVMRPLDRNQVLKFCQNPEMPTLGAFAISMAWGGQRMDHYRRCFERPALLVGLLEKLRKSEKSRLEDFALADGMQIPGLGVSFLTKLLFFCDLGVMPTFWTSGLPKASSCSSTHVRSGWRNGAARTRRPVPLSMRKPVRPWRRLAKGWEGFRAMRPSSCFSAALREHGDGKSRAVFLRVRKPQKCGSLM